MSSDDRVGAPASSARARIESWVARWVAFWDEREPPTCLALIRILLGLVVVYDLTTAAAHGAISWLWAPIEGGGVVGWSEADAPLFYRLFPPTAGSATLLWAGLLLSAIGIGAGCFTRASALAYVWFSVQAALINAGADRAIDRLIRMLLLILVLSPCAAVWSVDARRATGSFRGDPSPAPAWPRYLIFAQLVITYFGAGLAKGGTYWFPWGGYNALYLTLHDPILSSVSPRWLDSTFSHFITQVATAVTHLWELGAPLLLLAALFRRMPVHPGLADTGRPRFRRGGLRRIFLRVPVRELYVAVGVVFHLSLAVTLRLGIFPFAMLACFPAFFRPSELDRALRACRAVGRRPPAFRDPSASS